MLLLLWLLLLRRLLLLLLLLLRRRLLLLLLLLLVSGARPRLVDDGFVSHKLVAVLLEYGAGEGASADDEHALVVLLQLVYQRDEIAIAADDGEGIDVVVCEGHLERVEGQVESAPFLSPRGEGSRWTICTACSESARVAESCLPSWRKRTW